MGAVGLTGGIATGKSTVSGFFREAGAAVIDADLAARAVVAPNHLAHAEIVEGFGETILLPNREIDRAKLGRVIFNEPAKKALLERIIHPRVFAEMNRHQAEIEKERPHGLIILDVPLLFESGMARELTDVIVVYVPESVQLARLMKRDGYSEEEALARIDAQMPISEKRRRATIVIDNSEDLAETRKRTFAVYGKLMAETEAGT